MLRPRVFNDNIDRIFDHFFDDSFWKSSVQRDYQAINTDVKELDNSYEIDMELPGFSKEDVHIELEDGYLTVQARHTEEKDKSNKKYIRRERYYGHYQRSFFVGKDIGEEDVKAKFKDGVLTLDVPKRNQEISDKNKKYIAIEG